MPNSKTLVYLFRRDLRVADNPILQSLVKEKAHGYTHLLPIYVFPAQQLEVSGFIPLGSEEKSPYPEARSRVGGFWRCGPHRAKFLAESVWDLKRGLEEVGSGLYIRVGMVGEVIDNILKSKELNVKGVWMTGEEGVEEKAEERDVKRACAAAGAECVIWVDEKYLIDDADLPFKDPQELPDVFTTYRKMMEPLRNKPRAVLPTIAKNTLPTFPSKSSVPSQHPPFVIPTSLQGLKNALLKPLTQVNAPLTKKPPPYCKGAQSAHPFKGGEMQAHNRLNHLLSSGAMSNYHSTRNGLLGTDCSSKLSAYLALGCITSRQIHASMLAFEDGTNPAWSAVPGYGEGENEGTGSLRFELLWRDYMRLCNRKYGTKLFHPSGFKGSPTTWLSPSNPPEGQTTASVTEIIQRFLNGTTGMGLIDASQRELFQTGYTSNRARQNVASFLTKHLHIDWRIGAEWYECMLVDYDQSSNWGNWQYVAGVGNDPRDTRNFNPVKQAFDYDPHAEYVKTWIPELRGLSEPSEVFQAWTCKDEELRERLGLRGLKWVEEPLEKIDFVIARKYPRPRVRGKGNAGSGGADSRDAGRSGGTKTGGSEWARARGSARGASANRGSASSRGHSRGHRREKGGGGGDSGGSGRKAGQGSEKEAEQS